MEAGIIQIPAGLPDNTTLHHWRTPSHNAIWPDHKKPHATPDHTHS